MKKWFRKTFAPRPSTRDETAWRALWIIIKYHKIRWCWLAPHDRYVGFRIDWYDGPICCFGLWWGQFYTDHWL